MQAAAEHAVPATGSKVVPTARVPLSHCPGLDQKPVLFHWTPNLYQSFRQSESASGLEETSLQAGLDSKSPAHSQGLR